MRPPVRAGMLRPENTKVRGPVLAADRLSAVATPSTTCGVGAALRTCAYMRVFVSGETVHVTAPVAPTVAVRTTENVVDGRLYANRSTTVFTGACTVTDAAFVATRMLRSTARVACRMIVRAPSANVL